MTRRRWGVVGVVAAFIALVLFTKGPPKPTPNRAGAAFSFGAFGDAPYFAWQEVQYPLTLRDIDQNDVAFVIHVGDIFWRPCTDEMYRKSLARFDALRHPVIYTPGDNEWTDCWEKGSGAFRPQERLQRIREIFYPLPRGEELSHDSSSPLPRGEGLSHDSSSPLPEGEGLSHNSSSPLPRGEGLSHDSSSPLPAGEGLGVRGLVRQPQFIENARWEHGGVLFATVDIPGSGNGMEPFPGRTPEDDVANRQRTEAAAAWTREAFADAKARGAKAVVIAFQANMDLEKKEGDYQRLFEPFLSTLIEESKRFGRPVLALHGDGHIYTIDHPFRDVPNLTRLQVPGSPSVGWVRIFVTPDAPSPWAFEEHVVPRWKYW